MRKPAPSNHGQHLQHRNASDDHWVKLLRSRDSQAIGSTCSTLSNALNDVDFTEKSIVEQTHDIENHKAPSCFPSEILRGEISTQPSKSVLQVQRVAQIDWFIDVAGIRSFDLASRLGDVSLYPRYDVPASQVHKYLGWLAFNNTHEKREAQIRPHRYDSVPIIFFDDVAKEDALKIVAMYSACVVETSNEGGCHVWVHTDQELDEKERYLVQSYLVLEQLESINLGKIRADSGSISGEHWGRLCGFKNWKRGGCWVNLLAATKRKPLIITKSMLIDVHSEVPRKNEPSQQIMPDLTASTSTGRDDSSSGLDWGWTNEQLAKGADRDAVESELADRAAARGKPKPDTYAHRTVENAMRKLGM